jgi:chloride channel protein, CIC family
MNGETPQLSGGAYLRLVALGAAIGIPAALVAALFLALVHELEDWLWSSSPPWYAVVGLPVAGACIVIAARRLLPGDGGHAPLEGIGGGATPVEYVPGRRRCSPRPRHGWRCASSTRARANK